MEDVAVAPVAPEAVATPSEVAVPVEVSTALDAPLTSSGDAPQQTNEEIFSAFKASLSDDLKGHSYLDKYKTAEDFAKAGINHQSAFTKKASEYLSSEDAVIVAERNKFFGVPDDASGYEVSAELSEAVSEESLAGFKELAKEIDLPAKYLEPMVQFEADLWTKHAENLAAEKVAETEAVTNELKAHWKGDTFDHNTKQVQNLLLNELGLTSEDLSQSIGNSSKLITALFEKVVPMYGEDKLIEGTMTQTRASASERMTQINTEMFNASQGSPEHKSLMAEKVALMSKMS
jgi:hypothetical protein